MTPENSVEKQALKKTYNLTTDLALFLNASPL